MKTELRYYRGEKSKYYSSVYFEKIDTNKLEGVTEIISTTNKIIIWINY